MHAKLSPLQAKLLDMLQWFHSFCEEHHLRYYALGGTLLGAVRHQGFIPWDDDVDIGMPRQDYQRLQQLLKDQTGRYMLEYPGLKEDYFYPYSKLYDTTTTLVENTKNHLKRGVYLDIFPLDGLGNSLEEAIRRYRPLEKQLNLLLARTTGIRKGRYWAKNIAVLFARMIPSFLLDDKKLLRRIDALCQQYDFDTCAYVGNLPGAYRFKEIMPRAFFGDPTLYQFEDTHIYGVQDYQQYLTHLYGYWREFPSQSKQISPHDFIELDLHKSFLSKDLSS